MHSSKKYGFAVLIGNLLEHYGKVLYGLLAPFMAPFFFPSFQPITALLLAYLPVGLLSRPLGALFFGRMADRYGEKKVLSISLSGTSLCMIGIAFLPDFHTIGLFAPLLLHLFRGLILFFCAGEGTAAPLMLLDSLPEEKKKLISSLYEMSSIAGMILASAFLSLLLAFRCPENTWRLLFLIGALPGWVGCFLRRRLSDEKKSAPANGIPPISFPKALLPFTAIFLVTGFSCANYNIMFTMLTGYLPLITPSSPLSLSLWHTVMSLSDFCLLPFFAFLARKKSPKNILIPPLFFSILLTPFLFYVLDNKMPYMILLCRSLFILIGIAVAASYQFWIVSIVPLGKHRFYIIALAKALGSQWLGSPAISGSLWAIQQTGHNGAPAIYSALIAAAALGSLFLLRTSESPAKTSL